MISSKRPTYSSLSEDLKISRWKKISRWVRHRKFTVVFAVFLLATSGYYLLKKSTGRSLTSFMIDTGATAKKGLTIDGNKFMLNGSPFRIYSGSIHYFRVPREYWRDRLLKLKAAGLNTVDVYVAWNMHEDVRDHFDFSGNQDIVEFLTIAKDLGLYVILRPGPYICAEWDWGGLPAWLLQDPNMKVRTMYQGFTSAAEKFFVELFRRVAPLQISNGGPIIAVQIENEYGSYGEDKQYLMWLKNLLIRQGVVEFLFTSDGPDLLERGYLPGIYETVNYNEKTNEALDALEKFQPGRPLMTAEFWPGWFDHWMEKHHVMPPDDLVQRLLPNFQRIGSINFYMFHGGTNFGFMNGGNLKFRDPRKETLFTRIRSAITNFWSGFQKEYGIYQPTVTSYDYDAPLNEYGGRTEKYVKVRELLTRFQTNEEKQKQVSIPDPWANSRSPKSYGQYQIREYLLLTDALEIIQPLPLDLERPTFVEQLKTEGVFQLYFGFVVYRTKINMKTVKKITLDGVFADRMLVILDGKTVATFYSNRHHAPFNREIELAGTDSNDGHDLILLVENMGRANFVRFPHTLDQMYKGFNGNVHVDDASGAVAPKSWKIYSIRFKTPSELQSMTSAASAKDLWKPLDSVDAITQPAFYKAQFDLENVQTEFLDDTFVNVQDWTKGVVYANGVNLGRYWNVGPQQALYLPGPWLKKGTKNEVIVFELHKPSDKLKLQAEPQLGTACPLPCYPNF